MNIRQEKSVAITGYDIANILETSLELNLLSNLLEQISDTLRDLHNDGYDTFISCMNEGFEMMVSEAVVRLKEIYPDIKLVVVLPSVGYENGYSTPDRYKFKRIIEKSDKTVVIHNNEPYPSREMLDFIADNSSFVLCFCGDKLYKTEQIYLDAQAARKPIVNFCRTTVQAH